jgi:hypothetical protein
MRTECILVQGIELPSGKEDIIIVPYKGGNGKPVELLPEKNQEIDKYESRISEIALRGYQLVV